MDIIENILSGAKELHRFDTPSNVSFSVGLKNLLKIQHGISNILTKSNQTKYDDYIPIESFFLEYGSTPVDISTNDCQTSITQWVGKVMIQLRAHDPMCAKILSVMSKDGQMGKSSVEIIHLLRSNTEKQESFHIKLGECSISTAHHRNAMTSTGARQNPFTLILSTNSIEFAYKEPIGSSTASISSHKNQSYSIEQSYD